MNGISVGKQSKSFVSSFFFIFLFIAPQSIAAVIPFASLKPFLNSLMVGYVLCISYVLLQLVNKKNTKVLLFTSSFILLGAINLFIHNSNETFNLIGPVVAYLGYCFIQKKNIDVRVFDFFLVSLYIYYYVEYYSILPDLFFRPGFDEDAAVFDNSSSNAIPISLNVTLYAYMICNLYLDESYKGKVLLFSIINFALIIIQQSRAGIMIALVLVLLAFYEYSKKNLIIFSFIFSFTIGSIFFLYSNYILDFIDTIGDLNGTEALENDIRGEAQAEFFKDFDLFTFIFGHPKKVYAGVGAGALTYTYNVFLDMWNKYGVTQLIIFFTVFFLRLIRRNKYKFPIYYFIPFLLYCLVESIFLPNFWDCIIYILLFTPQFSIDKFRANNSFS